MSSEELKAQEIAEGSTPAVTNDTPAVEAPQDTTPSASSQDEATSSEQPVQATDPPVSETIATNEADGAPAPPENVDATVTRVASVKEKAKSEDKLPNDTQSSLSTEKKIIVKEKSKKDVSNSGAPKKLATANKTNKKSGKGTGKYPTGKEEEFQPTPDPLSKVPPPEESSSDPAAVSSQDGPQKPSQPKPKDAYPHRHYTPLRPTCNKLLAIKWERTLRKQHLQKLSLAKATIDNSAPKPYIHLQAKLKKLQMEEDRLAQIERNNRLLLEKMSHIMQNETYPSDTRSLEKHTLIRAHLRAKKDMQIQRENEQIVTRLEHKSPHYDHTLWETERLQNLTYLQNIAAFPQRFIDLRQEYERQRQQKVTDVKDSDGSDKAAPGKKATTREVREAERVKALRARFFSRKQVKKLPAEKQQAGKKPGPVKEALPEIPSTSEGKIKREASPTAPIVSGAEQITASA